MTKITGKTDYGYVPEDDEGAEDRPGLVPETGEENDLTVEQEGGGVIEPGKSGEGEGEGEEKPKYVFKSEEDLETFIKSRNKPAEPVAPAAPSTPAITTPQKDPLEGLEFWKGTKDEKGNWIGEAPKDWNDFARTVIRYVTSDDRKKEIVDYIRNMSSQEKKEIEDINAEFDAEYDGLAAQGLVPKRGTKEGDEINAQISTIGGKYNQTSMKAAYDLWSSIPKAKGGGLDYKAEVQPKTNPSKQASRLVGSSIRTGAAQKSQTKMSYEKLHSARSVDELLE